MTRRGGDLEAFTAFCLGGTAAFLSWLGLYGLLHAHGRTAPLVSAVIGLTCTVLAYRKLRTPAEVAHQLDTLHGVKASQAEKSHHLGVRGAARRSPRP